MIRIPLGQLSTWANTWHDYQWRRWAGWQLATLAAGLLAGYGCKMYVGV